MDYYQNVAANGIGNFQAQKFAKEEHLILPKDGILRFQVNGGHWRDVRECQRPLLPTF